MKNYHMETVVVVNKATGFKTFYKLVCGVFRRIGKADYDKIICEAWKASCMITTGNNKPKATHVRHYTTWHFRMSDLKKSV